ncbi:MAG: hypothetical protein WAO52_18950 [Prolixibacteraceae bacterium]
MDEQILERIITNAIGIGTIQTLAQLGLIDEFVTPNQAYLMFTRKIVEDWRHKRWIVGYPSGNKTRSKFYFKRSELETASRMLDIHNAIPSTFLNRIPNQILEDNARLSEVQKRQ